MLAVLSNAAAWISSLLVMVVVRFLPAKRVAEALTFLAAIFFILFFAPPIGLPLLGISEGTGHVIGLLAGGMIELLCTILPLTWVKHRVYRIGDE